MTRNAGQRRLARRAPARDRVYAELVAILEREIETARESALCRAAICAEIQARHRRLRPASGSRRSHRRCRTAHSKLAAAEKTYQTAHLGQPARSSPSRCQVKSAEAAVGVIAARAVKLR